MNEKVTVPNRKFQETYLTTPHPSLQERRSEHDDDELCIEHSCPIEYICFTCSDSVLCSQCLSTTYHLQHDLKNIERSKQFLKSQLQEWSIRLQSKSEILDVFYDQIHNNPAQIFKNAVQYKEKLASEFEELQRKLKQKLASIEESISQFTKDYKYDCLQKAQKIRLRRLQLIKMAEMNKEELENASVPHQAQYYSEKKQYVDSLLEEGQMLYFKQQLTQPNWGIEPDLFKNISSMLDKIVISFKLPEFFRQLPEFKEKSRQISKKSIKKLKKDLKLPDTQKIERHSSKARNSNLANISPFNATFTPKNTSKERKIKMKKSPGDTLLKKRKKSSAKILSMPVSPEKEKQQQVQISPQKSPKNFLKKK